jgi:hypothetical protein
MAITVIDTPYSGLTTRFNPAYNDMVFVLNETKFKSRPGFKFIVDVIVDGEKRAQLRQFPDFETEYGIANINEIVQAYLSSNLNCLKPGFSLVNNAVCTYQVSVGQEFSRQNRYTKIDFVVINSINYARFTTAQPHNLRVGDIVRVSPDDRGINPNGNISALRVAQIINDNTFRVTGPGGYTVIDNTGGWIHEGENFSDNAFSGVDGINYVGFTIPTSRPTRLKVGNTVIVHQFAANPTNPQYNGEWKVIKIHTVSGNQIITINCPYGNSSPVEEGVIFAYDNYEILNEWSSLTPSWAYNAAYQYGENHKVEASIFTPITIGKRFLTNAPKEHNVTMDDYHSLSFLGGTNFNGIYSQVLNIEVTKNNGQVIHHITGIPANPFSANGLDKSIIQEVGCGPKNIANLTTLNTIFQTQPINLNDVKSYKVWLSGTNLNTSGPSTEKIKFNIICPTKWQPIQLAFLNRLGTFDYYTFRLKNEKNLSIERATFNRKLGQVSSNKYGYNVGDRGTTVYNTRATESVICSSDYLNQKEADWLEELITSPEVFHIKNGQLLPVIILTNSFKLAQKVNDPLIIVTTEFKYANPKILQRGGESASNYKGATITTAGGTGTGGTGSGGTITKLGTKREL